VEPRNGQRRGLVESLLRSRDLDLVLVRQRNPVRWRAMPAAFGATAHQMSRE
jgi:hypothetical protein